MKSIYSNDFVSNGVNVNFDPHHKLKQDYSYRLTPISDSPDNCFIDDLVGQSKLVKELKQIIRKIAVVNSPVLIVGETGTGKELIARSLHKLSGTSGPFVAMNCGGIAPSLIQSELFGYEKGAFTGALCRKKGFIEAAQNGTLFFDEIGELPLDQQSNLLRFLQEGSIQRVGSVDNIRINTRVIAATNVDLEKAIKTGAFRADLFYRLNVLEIKMPTLRERTEDIQILANHFLNKYSIEFNKKVDGFSLECLHHMKEYNWPGNIRELMNHIKRAVILCDTSLLTTDNLGIPHSTMVSKPHSLKSARDIAEKQAIESTLYQCDKNITQTSKYLGISRAMLYRLIKKHELNF